MVGFVVAIVAVGIRVRLGCNGGVQICIWVVFVVDGGMRMWVWLVMRLWV